MTENKQRQYDVAYLRMASEWSKLSYCKRKQVGALIVKDKMIISDGYNGTPTGFENICEDEEGYTKWYVLHAEANAISKVAASTQSCKGATLYITMSPCQQCSKLIHQAGISRVVFKQAYKDESGLKFLRKAGVEVTHIPDLD
ncbi:MAG: dCMP deaminase family protein [Flavobacteriaceae bacterium]|nr:dCMP deaminase family protein [Flavobacteriaceae bacterium]